MDKSCTRIYRTNYQCLRCGNSEHKFHSKVEYSEVIVCPSCHGAAVDQCKFGKYLKQNDDKKRLRSILNNVVIRETELRRENKVIATKREYILSEDDYDWLIEKVQETI